MACVRFKVENPAWCLETLAWCLNESLGGNGVTPYPTEDVMWDEVDRYEVSGEWHTFLSEDFADGYTLASMKLSSEELKQLLKVVPHTLKE